MAQTTNLQTTVTYVTRSSVSTMGNPSFVLHTTDGTFRTSSNSSIAYSLDNDFRLNDVINVPVILTLTRAMRVSNYHVEG